MAETMTGLFGPSPYDVEQQRMAQLDRSASDFSQMNATQRGIAGMYKGAGMLAGAGAKAMGMVDPAVENANRMRQAAQGVDTSTPEGLMEYASKIQQFNPEMAAKAVVMARDMKSKAAAAVLDTRKADLAERRFEEGELQRDADRKQATADKLAAQIKIEADKLEQKERDGKRDDATRQMIANMSSAWKMATLEARTANATAKANTLTAEKPLTADQRMKWERKKGEDIGTLQAVETELNNMISQATALKSHPGLPGATGASGYLYSRPGGDAAKAEALLEEFKASTSGAGLEKVRMGGGIGAMTVQEWPLVEKMIANIDPVKLGLKGTQDAIDKVINKMTAMVSVAQKRYGAIHNESAPGEMDGEPPTASTPSPGGATPATQRNFKVLGKE